MICLCYVLNFEAMYIYIYIHMHIRESRCAVVLSTGLAGRSSEVDQLHYWLLAVRIFPAVQMGTTIGGLALGTPKTAK